MRHGPAFGFALALVGSLVLSSPARAEQAGDRLWLRAGAFRPAFDSKARIDVPGTPIEGTEIDFEDDLGLEGKDAVFDIEGGVRITHRFRLEAGYVSLGRTRELSLGRDIRWEETVYPVRARVEAGLGSDIYRVAAGYSLLRSERAELGLRAGAHITTFRMFIEGEASFNDQSVGLKREEKDQTVPLPHLGLFANYDLSDRLTLHGNANYFALEVGKYRGQIVDLSAGVSARILPRIGVGARYRYVGYGVRARSDRWQGRVDYTFHGPALFLEAAL